MNHNLHDALFNFLQPVALLRVVTVTLTPLTWTNVVIPSTPLEPDRYHLQIEASDTPYELRFHESDDAGIRIPANVLYVHPQPLARDVVPGVRSVTAAELRVLVSFPAS